MENKPADAPPLPQLDARLVRTRAALRDAMLVLLEKHPFDQITIRDIVAESRTGYATFFRHYRDKGELLHAAAADQISAVIRLAMPMVETDSRAAALALCRYVDEHRALWSALLTGGGAGVVREEFIRQTRQIALVRPSLGTWLPDDLRVIFGVCAAVEILAWWLHGRDDIPIEQVATILDRLVVAPMVAAD